MAVQVFLVNDRAPAAGRSDEAFAFQAALELRCEEGFVPRPDLRGAGARADFLKDWDQQVNGFCQGSRQSRWPERVRLTIRPPLIEGQAGCSASRVGRRQRNLR